ncbi:uncharacterized protein J8A68_001569 [[Candida] subhashii]|uniref:mRNA-capping enzyme subunit beta n=1 Tax=[Candida] subhashii TaxID=561895 RepID=A0A8J5UQM2_9ASCO|nr:uncharacterized protein J8A68_001569 [[Candida] subhashii]KAG7664876.1 hypothetical protein J8A68_001569 [[Candida] subhashii]
MSNPRDSRSIPHRKQFKNQRRVKYTIPRGPINRSISKWITDTVETIDENDRECIEIEVKFGKILDKSTQSRVNLPKECLLRKAGNNINFQMEVQQSDWQELHELLENKTRTNDISNKVFSSTTENAYHIGQGQNERRVRISTDNLSDPPVFTAVEKKRISDLFIHTPFNRYDFRISISLEIPEVEIDLEKVTKEQKSFFTRFKKRTSWRKGDTLYEFTRALEPKEGKTNKCEKYEIELEMNPAAILDAISKKESIDEVVDNFIFDARSINYADDNVNTRCENQTSSARSDHVKKGNYR